MAHRSVDAHHHLGGVAFAGVETARKVLDNSLPSNELLGAVWTSSENKPI